MITTGIVVTPRGAWTKARNHGGASTRESDGATIAAASAFSPRPTRTWRRNCRLDDQRDDGLFGFWRVAKAGERGFDELLRQSRNALRFGLHARAGVGENAADVGGEPKQKQRREHETKTMPQRDISPHETAPEQSQR